MIDLQAIKQRNCHVKLAIFDDCVGMAGNGNQDTQSWYHSQEVNVLLDSRQVCEDWLNGLHHNQNTSHYGRIDPKDGVWRDAKGQTVAVLDRLVSLFRDHRTRIRRVYRD